MQSPTIDVPRHVYYRFEYSEAFPQPFRDACPVVIATIKKEGLKPDMYFVELTTDYQDPKILRFILWDVRAFPLDPMSVGNPGGECRTVLYDPAKKAVTKVFGWR